MVFFVGRLFVVRPFGWVEGVALWGRCIERSLRPVHITRGYMTLTMTNTKALRQRITKTTGTRNKSQLLTYLLTTFAS